MNSFYTLNVRHDLLTRLFFFLNSSIERHPPNLPPAKSARFLALLFDDLPRPVTTIDCLFFLIILSLPRTIGLPAFLISFRRLSVALHISPAFIPHDCNETHDFCFYLSEHFLTLKSMVF